MLRLAAVIGAAAAIALAQSACDGTAGGRSVAPAMDSPMSTPALHAVATPTPQPMTASPQSLSFTAAGTVLPFYVNEAGYTSTFVATLPAACAASMKLLQTKLLGPNATFDVLAIKAGKCDIPITDSHKQKAIVRVYVTTTGGSVG